MAWRAFCGPSQSNPLTIKPSPRPQPSEPGKQKLHLQGGNNADAKFWDMMEAVAAGALSAEETATFIGNMKKVYADLPEMVNLEDLNVAASLIQTN